MSHTCREINRRGENAYFEIMLFSFSMMTRATIKMTEMVYLIRILVCDCVQRLIRSQIIPSSSD